MFTVNGVDYVVNDPNITNEFSASTDYAIGDLVYYQGYLYRFIAPHSAGAWNASHVQNALINGDLRALRNAIKPNTSTLISGTQYRLNIGGS